MRILQNKTNVDPPLFPDIRGKIRDNPGNNTGTPVNELLYGDVHQAMEFLLLIGQVVANDLPENATNGYQSAVAFQNLCKIMFGVYNQVGGSLQPPYQNGWQSSTYINATDGMRFFYDVKTNRVHFSGASERGTPLDNTTVFNLPSGYRPTVEKAMPILMLNAGTFIPGIMKIATNGNVSFLTNAGAASLSVYIVDGVSFNRD